MAFFVTPETIVNPRRLNLRRLAAPMLGRGLRVVPRRPLRSRTFWRIVFDQAMMRFILALLPFPVAALVWPHLALAISQAPLLMFGVVLIVESKLLSVPTPAKRRALISEADEAHGLDLLRVRSADVLGRLAAGREYRTEVVHLVIEQSGLARVPVLTLISAQLEAPEPGKPPILLDLTEPEREMIETRLFDADFTEGLLHTINLRENRFIRDIPFEARGVSAHARLMAMAAAQG